MMTNSTSTPTLGGGTYYLWIDVNNAIAYNVLNHHLMIKRLSHSPGLECFVVCVGSVTTLLLAETKESERMDTSSKQQRTYEESKRESGKRNGKSKEVKTETGKV
jgi:hypothetical protein